MSLSREGRQGMEGESFRDFTSKKLYSLIRGNGEA